MTRRNDRPETAKRMILAAVAALLVLCTAACGKADKEENKPDASIPESSVSEVQDTGTPAPEVIKVKTATVGDITGTLNIRSEPNTDCEVLGSAVAGDTFDVLTENVQPGWHEVSYKGGKAYVSAEFTKVTEEEQAAPTPTPDPNAPIIVNGSGREDVTEENSEEGMTAESIKETEDPARR